VHLLVSELRSSLTTLLFIYCPVDPLNNNAQCGSNVVSSASAFFFFKRVLKIV